MYVYQYSVHTILVYSVHRPSKNITYNPTPKISFHNFLPSCHKILISRNKMENLQLQKTRLQLQDTLRPDNFLPQAQTVNLPPISRDGFIKQGTLVKKCASS